MKTSDCYYLVTIDSKGQIRQVAGEFHWDNEKHAYIINRYSGVYQGKITKHPEILVERGKVNRTPTEQVNLQFNHIIKEYCDKGYKVLDKPANKYSIDELKEITGNVKTSPGSIPKPMLAKQVDKVTNTKIFNKEWYASRKIDGLRILIYLGEDGKLHTASRGATNYDAAMYEILHHPNLISYFKEHPDLIMDGEGYKHGATLQQINHVARTQVKAVDYEFLQFYWYDIVDTTKSFEERYIQMLQIKDELNLDFNPEKEFEDEELRIQFVPQIKISGYDNMIKLHNDLVEDGWEGLVIRDPEKPYKPAGRTNDMIKIKVYKSEDFKVVGYELGLRGSEDMVFVMEMEDGKTFKAKPLGDRLQKEEYVNNFDKLYKEHIGECKFFYYSEDGIPLQPAFKAFRDDLK